MKRIITFLTVMVLAVTMGLAQSDGQIRVIVIGAHPDDCDVKFGGTAALFAEMVSNSYQSRMVMPGIIRKVAERWLNAGVLKRRKPDAALA